MKLKRSICSVFVVFCALCLLESVTAKQVRVFLLGGQSNMAGAGSTKELHGDNAKYASPQDDVKLWRGGAWISLAPDQTRYGPELGFGRAMKDAYPDEEIYLIKHAVGGTSLHHSWNPKNGGDQYKKFMKKAKAALANLKADRVKYEITAMLWMQGESDASDGMGGAYDKNIREFIAHMRDQFDAPEMRFVMGRIRNHFGRKTGQAKIVRDTQQAVAESMEGVEWFDTDHYPLFDGGHYNGIGLIMMGKDFAKALPIEKSKPKRRKKRNFRSVDGTKSFVATFNSYNPKTGVVVVTSSNFRKMRFKIDMLSKEDQEYIKAESE